jgi:hypothetical protein
MTTITLTYIFNRVTDVINSCNTQDQLDIALVYYDLLLRKGKAITDECESKYILAAVESRREIIEAYGIIEIMKEESLLDK